MLKLNSFYIGESVEWMQNNMEDNFVDLTVTSPPYDDLRKYNGFKFDYKSMLKELYRITKDGGVVVWVVGDKTHNGSETGTSFNHALHAKEIGFNLHDTMIYLKNVCPFPEVNRYYQGFEYMFIFTKGKLKTFNSIKDRENKSAGRLVTGTQREKDGTTSKKICLGNEIKKYGVRFNYWLVSDGKRQNKHPAVFPEQLAKDHIISWSNEEDIVFDPMCGSGTTCKMAWLNNRKFIGVDMSEEYINDICMPRLKKHGWGNTY